MGSFLSSLGGVLSNVSAGYADPTFAARMLQKDKDRVKNKEDAKELKKFESTLGLDTEDEKRTREDKYISGFLSTLTGGDQAKTAELLAQARSGALSGQALNAKTNFAKLPGATQAALAEQNAQRTGNELTAGEAGALISSGVPEAEALARREAAVYSTLDKRLGQKVLPTKMAYDEAKYKMGSEMLPIQTATERARLLDEQDQLAYDKADRPEARKDTVANRAAQQVMRNFMTSVTGEKQNILGGRGKVNYTDDEKVVLGLNLPGYPASRMRQEDNLLSGPSTAVLLQQIMSGESDARQNANPPMNPTPNTSTRRRRSTVEDSSAFGGQ